MLQIFKVSMYMLSTASPIFSSSCPRLHLGFSTEKELKKHVKIQHPDPAAFAWRFPKVRKDITKHGSTICTKEFKRAHSLKIHMRTHDNLRPFKCEFCNKSFDRRDSCERHEEKVHGRPKGSTGTSSLAATSSPISSSTPIEDSALAE
jgi:uncharacterized Zn-finger protein